MKKVTVWIAILFCLKVSDGSLLNFLRMPSHDGVSRVKYFTEEQIAEITGVVTLPGTTVVLVDDGNVTEPNCTCRIKEVGNFSEVLAQLLVPEKVEVVSVKIKNPALLNGSLYKLFGVHIFVNDKHYNYRGKKDLAGIVSYLRKLKTFSVKVIKGKLDKLAFDAVIHTRLVGFFVNGTTDFQAYEAASKILAPDVSMYAVFDRLVAKHLKLDTVGQIFLHKPGHRLPVPCTLNPASTLDIETFVKENAVSPFLYLTDENLDEILALDLTPNTVIAIGERTAAIGGYFNRLLTRVIRNNTDHRYESLSVIWIDPENFPIISMMTDYLSKTYGMPRVLPAMGIVEFSTNKSAWFGSQLLNMTADKHADDQNVAVIKTWLSSVVDSTLLLEKSHGKQSLIRSPKNMEVEEGSTFDLDCIVQNIMGDCLWLRNGHNIGYNLDRIPHLSWVGDVSLGDCSIRFAQATAGRDDGSWVCEITGDTTNPTVSSFPVEIVVKPAATPKTDL